MQRRHFIKQTTIAACMVSILVQMLRRGYLVQSNPIFDTSSEIMSEIDKMQYTNDIFNEYHKRFLQVALNRKPISDRQEITRIVKECLGIKDEWIPTIRTNEIGINVASSDKGGYSVKCLHFTSWEGICGTAHLYLPATGNHTPKPLVFLLCGHGRYGKTDAGYKAMAARLVKQGAAVLVPDNLGQGERVAIGHADAVYPFACNTSVVGLIVMESIGWVKWAVQQPEFDTSKIAVIGNSGGGTYSMFVGALCPEIACVAPSGYPSSFDFILRKEKKHCHCNILPGIIEKLEMTDVFGLVSPRKLYISQGLNDEFFPVDLFYELVRKVQLIYGRTGNEKNFRYKVFNNSLHSWDNEKRIALGNYLSEMFGIAPAEKVDDSDFDIFEHTHKCADHYPACSMTMDQLAMRLTSRSLPEGLNLWDVYSPNCDVQKLTKESLRGNTMQIFAQFEAALSKK